MLGTHPVQSGLFLLLSGLAPQGPPGPAANDSTRPGPVLAVVLPRYDPAAGPAAADTSARRRPKAVRYSDGYYKRLAVHRDASYAMLPLFIAEYALGQSLYNRTNPADTVPASGSLHTWHGVVANAIIVLFGVNTYTGALNLEESSKNPEGSARRSVHAALMVLSDIGFVVTGQLAPGRDGAAPASRRNAHRTVAILSMSTALVGDAMMLIWNH
jgi:hypothetical protein